MTTTDGCAQLQNRSSPNKKLSTSNRSFLVASNTASVSAICWMNRTRDLGYCWFTNIVKTQSACVSLIQLSLFNLMSFLKVRLTPEEFREYPIPCAFCLFLCEGMGFGGGWWIYEWNDVILRWVGILGIGPAISLNNESLELCSRLLWMRLFEPIQFPGNPQSINV